MRYPIKHIASRSKLLQDSDSRIILVRTGSISMYALCGNLWEETKHVRARNCSETNSGIASNGKNGQWVSL